MEKEINKDELVFLESYFCKPGEFSFSKIQSNTGAAQYLLKLKTEDKDAAIESQVQLICKGDQCYMTSSPQHISFNLLNGSITKKRLEAIKETTLKQKESLLKNDQFTLFEFITWISNEVQHFLETSQDNSVIETSNSYDNVYGVLLKLDHIRSTNRYYKFFRDTSKQNSLNLKLMRCGKLSYILVFGSEDCVKEYIKVHRTSLVDVDSNGKPCKERLLQVKTKKMINNDLVEQLNLRDFGFSLLEFEDYAMFEKTLESFSFSKSEL